MDWDRFPELHQWKDQAKSLAYRWFRHHFPRASHQKAWKFAGLAWTRFLKKRPTKLTEIKPVIGPELSPDDTSLPA